MPCSACRQSGHNIRTCPTLHAVADNVRDLGIEAAAEQLAEQLGEEALSEIIEFGLDATIPGSGTILKACRWYMRSK